MMSLCSNCGSVVRVIGDARQVALLVGEESSLWPNGYVCPVCDGAAVGVPAGVSSTELLSGQPGERLFELTPEEALALHMGLGMPDERRCTLEAVEAALSEGVARWGLESDLTSSRVYLAWLETGKGTRLFLGAGPHGSLVYRIRNQHRYAERIDNGS